MTSPVFLLAPGRSFTTVVSVMLGQNPQLFDIPETNIAIAPTVGDWLDATSGAARPFLRAGLLRAIAYLETRQQTTKAVIQAQRWLEAHRNMTTPELFDMLRASTDGRGLVEKSPRSAVDDTCLEHMLSVAPDARFIHMTRHPYTNCQSIIRAEWYHAVLKSVASRHEQAVDGTAAADPQYYWLDCHERIIAFEKKVPPGQWLRVRGEEILEAPEAKLAELCRWLEIDESSAAIALMIHPENSPFASFGPPLAMCGNDPNFLNDPILRKYSEPDAPLRNPLPWRNDGAHFENRVQALAEEFGYTHGELERTADEHVPLPPKRKLVGINLDGAGSPVPHCNMLDNSLSGLPPLRTLSSVEHIPFPTFGGINFGAYTGERITVAVYEGNRDPAIVAYDNQTGHKLWQTPLDVFSAPKGSLGRWVGGVLMAKLTFEDGTETRRIFAGNRTELLCFDEGGKIVWRLKAAEILGSETESFGTLRCLRITADRNVLFITARGVAVKFVPDTGALIDVYRLDHVADCDGRLVEGRFKVSQSIVLVGDYVYAQATFDPHSPIAEPERAPVCLLRFRVSGLPDGRIGRLQAPDTAGAAPDRHPISIRASGLQGGSPSGMFREDGTPVIIANGHNPEGGFWVRAIADEAGTLQEQWCMPLPDPGDPTITAAPANDPETGLYICTTKAFMFLVRNAAHREGEIAPDITLEALDLLAPDWRTDAVAAELSSPMTLARDPGEEGFVCYVGMAVMMRRVAEAYPVLTALEFIPSGDELQVTPLWTVPIVLSEDGLPAPAPRSFAQPAIFQYDRGGTAQTGMVMGTLRNGIAILR